MESALKKFSIGFQTLEHKYEEIQGKMHRRVSKWWLAEYSVVPLAEQVGAQITAAKALMEAQAIAPEAEPPEDETHHKQLSGPEMKSYEYDADQQTVELLSTANLIKTYSLDEAKAGRVLSAANEGRLRQAITVMNEILALVMKPEKPEAEPEEETPAPKSALEQIVEDPQAWNALIDLVAEEVKAA